MFFYYNDIDGVEYFYVIMKIMGFFSCLRFCIYCFKFYEKFYKYSCIKYCNICLFDNCVKREIRMCMDCYCICCLDVCYLCYKLFMEGGGIFCELMYKCIECF